MCLLLCSIAALRYNVVEQMADGKKIFVVQFPYDAQLMDELSISPCDKIEVEKWELDEQWIYGKLQSSGQRGKVFKGFLKNGEEEEAKQKSLSVSELEQDWVGSDSTPIAAYKGKQYKLQETPQDWLQCIICRELACCPRQSLCCGQTLCSECTEQWGKHSNSCPHCRREPFEIVTDPRSERYIAGLTCFCPNTPNGCKWRGSLKKVEDHVVLECPYENVQCTNCDKVMQRRNIPAHSENDCEWREVACPCCGSLYSSINMSDVDETFPCDSGDSTARMTFHDLVNSHYRECPQWPVRCPNSDSCNSGLSFTRASLAEHLNENCPQSLVECQFAAMGCESAVLRKDLPQHLSESLVTHMQLLLADYSCVKANVSRLTARIGKLRRKNRNLKSLVYWHMPEKRREKLHPLNRSTTQ